MDEISTIPVNVIFRGVPASEALCAHIEEQAQRLARFSAGIDACRVIIGAERRPHHGGDAYRADVHLTLGRREFEAAEAHDADLYRAVSAAFDAAKRRLQDQVRRRRSVAKAARKQPVSG